MSVINKNITFEGLTYTLDDRDRVAASIVLDNQNTFSTFQTFAAGKGLANGEADISGLTAVTITGDTTAALNTHSIQKGAYINCATDAVTVTLPAVTVGSSYIIVNSAADGGALLTISPNGTLVNPSASTFSTDNVDFGILTGNISFNTNGIVLL